MTTTSAPHTGHNGGSAASTTGRTARTQSHEIQLEAARSVRPVWEKYEPGYWTCNQPQMAVCKERDRMWHNYATDEDTITHSPRFRTLKQAMRDAEQRS
jgi:hypothetical protein